MGRKFNSLGRLFTKGLFKSLMGTEDSVKNLLKYEIIIATMDFIHYIRYIITRDSNDLISAPMFHRIDSSLFTFMHTYKS